VLSQLDEIYDEYTHHENADRDQICYGVPMHTVYGTNGWNRKENEIEKEVLDQVKFEETVPNIHL